MDPAGTKIGAIKAYGKTETLKYPFSITRFEIFGLEVHAQYTNRDFMDAWRS